MRHARGIGIAAAAVLALSAPARAQMVKSYGKLGAWSVSLAKDPTGDEICVVSSRQPPNGPAGYNLSFVVDSNYTRLFLGYQGAAMPTPAAVGLQVDDSALANLLVTAPRRDFGDDLHLIFVDLPTGLLENVIFPAMAAQPSITAQAGGAQFTVPTTHFAEIMTLVDDCARQERKDDLGRA
jgi:hypothetical protein